MFSIYFKYFVGKAILCPLGMTAAFWGRDNRTQDTDICYIADANNNEFFVALHDKAPKRQFYYCGQRNWNILLVKKTEKPFR